VIYPTYDEFLLAACEALGTDIDTVRHIAARSLAESALAAPAAGFGGHERYPDLAEKAAVLLQRLVSNHPLRDGNKRTEPLCTILFVNLNHREWGPPERDETDGAESAEVVEAAAAGGVPLPALRAWIDERINVAEPLRSGQPKMMIYPAEYVGALHYEGHRIDLGDLTITDVSGFNPAGVYVRRISGKTEGISVAEIIISVVGDRYAQEQLDAENAEAGRYPLGSKEYWRGRLVGEATFTDGHVMTDEEFEAEWAESEEES
jgi:death-on-curing protein